MKNLPEYQHEKQEYFMSKRTGWLLATAAVIVIIIFLAIRQPGTTAPAAVATALPNAAASQPTVAPTEAPVVLPGATTTASGLQYLETAAGDGVAPQAADVVTLNYKL